MDWGFGITKNKAFEIQAGRFDEWSYFDFSVSWDRKCDHAGFHIFFELFSFILSIDFYDVRHWNYKKNEWYVRGEE